MWTLLLCIIGAVYVECQLKREPLIIAPEKLLTNNPNEILICVSSNASIRIVVKERLNTLHQGYVTAPPGIPFKIVIPPLPLVPTYLITVYIQWNGYPESYLKTFHLPSSTNVHQLQIETDKPRYRPSEEVKIRLLPLTRKLLPSYSRLQLSIRNAQDLVVYKETFSARPDSYYIATRFKLPYYQANGRWTIIVKDDVTDTRLGQKYFEVQKYSKNTALQNFQVLLISDKESYVNLNETFRFIILARFPIGPLVSGSVTVKCGDDKQILVSQMTKGQFSFAFQLYHCFNDPVSDNINYVQFTAEVRDFGTGEKQNTTLKVHWQPILYSFDVKPLKPGLTYDQPFPVKVTLSSKYNQQIKNISVSLVPICIARRNERIARTIIEDSLVQETDDKGNVLFNVPTNISCLALFIEVSLRNATSIVPSTTSFFYPKIFDKPKCVIEMKKYYYKAGERIDAKISLTKYNISPSQYNYMITCSSGFRHHGVIIDNVINFITTTEMRPECMLSVYVIDTNGVITIDDMKKFFTTDSCQQVSINTMINKMIYRPGENVTFEFRGSPSGGTAVTAIDQKLEFLFANYYSDIKPDYVQEQQDIVDRLFSLNMENNIVFDSLKDRFTIANDACCTAGYIWWQMRSSCPLFNASTVKFHQTCQDKFYGCCSSIKQPTPMPSCRTDSRLNRCRTQSIGERMQSNAGPPVSLETESSLTSVNDYDVFQISLKTGTNEENALDETKHTVTSRSYFPEVWLFDELYLSAFNGTGYLDTSFPDSITNWTIYGQFYAPGQGICQKSLTLSTNQSIFTQVDLPREVYVGDQLLTKISVVNMSPEDQNIVIIISRPVGLCSEKPWTGDRYIYVSAFNSSSFHVPFEFLTEGNMQIEFTLRNKGEDIDVLIKRVKVVKKRVIDQSLEYTFVFNLSHPSIRRPIKNDIFEFYSEMTDTTSNNMVSKFKLTENARRSKHIDMALLEISTLHQSQSFTSGRDKNNLEPVLKYQLGHADYLNELLRAIPVLMKLINERMHVGVNDQQLIEAKLLLQNGLLDILSFRNKDGSYSAIRQDYSKPSLWLSLIATLIQCSNDVDESIVCHSIDWITSKQLDDGRFPTSSFDNTFSVSDGDDQTLFAAIFAITSRQCLKYCRGLDPAYDERVRKSLRLLRSINFQRSDLVLLASASLALSKWQQYDSAKSYRESLFAKLEQNEEDTLILWPYMPASNSWYDPLKHSFSNFVSRSYRRKLLSNRILLNALGVLIQNEIKSVNPIQLSDVITWLYEKQENDGAFISALDTYFALEAIQLHEQNRDRFQLTNVEAKVSLYCHLKLCYRVTLDSVNGDLTKILPIPSDQLNNMTFVINGKGVIAMTFRLISVPAAPFQRDYPVKLYNKGYFSINQTTISSIAIEHGLLVEHVPQLRTFTMVNPNGTATLSSIEMSSDAVHIQFNNLRPFTNYCYSFETVHGPGSRIRVTKSSPVLVARHNEYGIVGMKMIYKSENVPLLEKYCPNDEECYCLETGCPLPNGRCDSICHDTNDVLDNTFSLVSALCQKTNYGAIIQIIRVRNETHDSSPYDYIDATVNIEFPTKHMNIRELLILRKSSCPCPVLETNRFYFLIINKDQLTRNLEDTNEKPLVIVGQHTFFEPAFSNMCSSKRQMDILKLTENDSFNAFCQSRSTNF